MGRIRTIKPELPWSEKLGSVSRDARLSLILLLTLVDDSGRTRGAFRLLSSQLFPFDDDAPKFIGGWMAELDKIGSVIVYTCEDNQFVQVTNWLKHQKIDKPTPSRLPEFVEGSPNCRRVFPEHSTPVSRTMDLVSRTITPLPPLGDSPAQTALPGAAPSSPESESKKRKRPQPEPIMIPDTLAQHPGFAEAWGLWESYRREGRKTMNTSTRNAQLQMLAKHGPSVALEMMATSITNGWTGLFPPDDNRNKRNGSTQPDCLDAANYVGAPCMSEAEIGGVPF